MTTRPETARSNAASPVLAVDGLCARAPLNLAFDDLAAMAPEHQVSDVSELLPGRRGTALRFSALVECLVPATGARYVHVVSSDGSFSASLDLDLLGEQGIILYGLDGMALPEESGGPFRLFVTDSEDCSVNVKSLKRITFAAEPGAHTAACAEDSSNG